MKDPAAAATGAIVGLQQEAMRELRLGDASEARDYAMMAAGAALLAARTGALHGKAARLLMEGFAKKWDGARA